MKLRGAIDSDRMPGRAAELRGGVGTFRCRGVMHAGIIALALSFGGAQGCQPEPPQRAPEPRAEKVLAKRRAVPFVPAPAKAPAGGQAGLDSALLNSARSHHSSETIQLLERGADVNAHGVHGNTVLHLLARDTPTVPRLLEAGADPNARNEWGHTPLIYSSRRTAAMMLEAGADVHMVDREGRTALHHAADSGGVGRAELLLDHGAAVDAREYVRADTPLMLAVCPGDQDMGPIGGSTPTVRLLLERGADPAARNNRGETALQRALRCRRYELDRLERYPDSREQPNWGNVLGRAAVYSLDENIRLLRDALAGR